MSDIEEMGQGNCPDCGRQTSWHNGVHFCRECGQVEGPIEGNGPRKKQKVCMMFKHDKPYTQLRRHGEVATVRSERKERGPVWISRGYPGKGYGKVCEAYRERGREIDPREEKELFLHLKDSGFSTVQEWQDKIRENGSKDELPEKAYLHKVHLKKISIRQYFWASYEDGSPDQRGIQSFIAPHEGVQLANAMIFELPEIIIDVVGDDNYEH